MRLYIDPGTGSMLFTILIGLIGVARYAFKTWFLKAKFVLGGGRKSQSDGDRLPLVIFADDKRYWLIFEPICRELAAKNFPVKYLTFSKDDAALSCEYADFKAEYIGNDNKAFAKLNFLNAVMVLSTTPGLDVYQWKRSREVDCYIHIPHAPSDITLYRMFGIDYYDAILLSGDYQIKQVRALEKLRNLPAKELTMVGLPYMDEMQKRAIQFSETEEHQRTVLLAPSWGPSAILTKYGEKMIKALLETGYHIVIRPHPQSFQSEKLLMDKLMQEFPNSENLEWNRDTDNFSVLGRSDILISDFSGVIFDYALIFDRSVIYTNEGFDDSVYDAWWLDEMPWVFRILPSLGMELNENKLDDLKNLIDTCISASQFAEGRKRAREETWQHQGVGAKKVADYLIKKYQQSQTNAVVQEVKK